MTPEKLAKLKEDLAADPGSRVLRLAVEVLEAELAIREDVDRAISEVMATHQGDVDKARHSDKVVGRLIGLVRASLGGRGDPTYVGEEIRRRLARY